MECINPPGRTFCRVNACERSSQKESISSLHSESGNAVAALYSPSSATTSSNMAECPPRRVGTLHNSK
ncbi:MAG: hypothetical protein COT43_09665 [Candidatus Marinimicrobia bacterium CG08_land_8_20_14_0_20_45_22]|nr:MAG: hypothetical protein COT43_09665 [Candidatus Marinimicrobia bacterium CG08_land_8_20_14_0_20_45_22]